jgi:hypothetical protein
VVYKFAGFHRFSHLFPANFRHETKATAAAQSTTGSFLTAAFIVINHAHSLVKLARVVDWQRLDDVFGQTYCPDQGRPAISTRLMVALHYLKYTHNLSDEDVVAGWVENPYWQYLRGMQFFEHELPIDPSSMTRWRKRIEGVQDDWSRCVLQSQRETINSTLDLLRL